MFRSTIGVMLVALLAIGSGVAVSVVAAGTVSAQGAGRTIAPDLVAVSDFRSGEDANGNNTTDTYVDFFFDEPAAVVSCCAGFELVPIDGGPPLTAIAVVDGDGTATLTLAFEGDVRARDIARGTVNSNTVRAADGGDETNKPTAGRASVQWWEYREPGFGQCPVGR